MKIVFNIDDLEMNRTVVTMFIKKLYPSTLVIEAEDCLEAEAKLRELNCGGYKIHSVVCDFNMPGPNGFETAKRFRDNGYTGPFYILTANYEINATDCEHVNRLFHKPLTLEMVRTIMQ